MKKKIIEIVTKVTSNPKQAQRALLIAATGVRLARTIINKRKPKP